MTQTEYEKIEQYMLECMSDSAHDKEHVYRVLYIALDIANYEEAVDYDVLITASLLHDIGREEQFRNPALDHAEIGAKKAQVFLIGNGYCDEFAHNVADCIYSHRFRTGNAPKSMEGKILFDADKVDVTGAIGIARTILYKGQVGEPLYSVDQQGNVMDGSKDTDASFFQEYKYKLEGLYDKFYTKRGSDLAEKRRNAASVFYDNLLDEVSSSYQLGKEHLDDVLLKK